MIIKDIFWFFQYAKANNAELINKIALKVDATVKVWTTKDPLAAAFHVTAPVVVEADPEKKYTVYGKFPVKLAAVAELAN